MLSLQEQRILGELTDTTFGRSSIRDAGHAIAYKTYTNHSYPTGDNRKQNREDFATRDIAQEPRMIIEIRFETIVNMNPVDGLQSAQKDLDDKSIKAINEAMKELKTEFKAEAGVTLKLEEDANDKSTLIPISFNPGLFRGRYFKTLKYIVKN